MDARLDPLIHEFDTLEDADRYDKWFRAEVEASLSDPAPSIAHDQVFAEMDALIAAKRKARNAR
ncbi:type II toxin-antitoxin system RelB family antitoxin [Caballeronia ptereochthonis]|uniref:type II toxin-antitoxin system RelB family antitoxin n=1 Tax=Caballeronia ptereochthonis TaxID=1777144 RepID=UPI000AB10D0B|nr:antitoxin [Caballeronia ptereochthonis]